MLQNIKPSGLAMFSGDISESINRFLKHGQIERSNRGGGCRVEGVDEVAGRHWSAIHRGANVQAQCMTWLFAYFDVSWVCSWGAAVASALLGQGCHGSEEGPGSHAGFPEPEYSKPRWHRKSSWTSW